MTTALSERVVAYDGPDLIWPGRAATFNTSSRRVILPEPAVWQFNLVFAESNTIRAPQGLYNRMKGGAVLSLDLSSSGLSLPSIPESRTVTSQSLGTDYLELVTTVTGFSPDDFFLYGSKLYQIADLLLDRVRAIPRPSALPTQGDLQPLGSVNVWMPELTNPQAYRHPIVSSLTMDVRTV